MEKNFYDIDETRLKYIYIYINTWKNNMNLSLKTTNSTYLDVGY